jgi:hypothetical protein
MLKRLLRSPGRPTDDWSEAELPQRGPCFLVVDGLGTSSREMKLSGNSIIIPWLPVLRSQLPVHGFSDEEVRLLRGFSYSGYGTHYSPPHTSILFNPDSALQRLRARNGRPTPLEGYGPGIAFPITYLTFSFGGPIILLAIAEWLKIHRSESDAKKIRAIILVQPGFDIGCKIRRAAATMAGLPAPISEVYEEPERIYAHIRQSLALILDRHVPVWMLYWPDDQFVRCDDAFLSDLGLTKKYRVKVAPTFDDVPENARDNHYVLHGAVARDAEIHRWIVTLLRRPQRSFWSCFGRKRL